MRIFVGLLSLVVLALVLSAGAAQDKATPPDKEKSPFTGDYTGVFKGRSLNPNFPDNQKGSFKVTVTSDGKLKAEIRNTTLDFTNEMTGKINKDGEIESEATILKQVYTFRGKVTKTKEGHFQATLKQYLGKDAVVELDMKAK